MEQRPMYGSNEPESVSLRALQDEKYILCDGDRQISDWLDFVAFPSEYREDIAACLVWIEDGDLIEIWFSERAAWYDLSAQYHNLAYYLA